MKRAYIVTGAESSGTKLLTRILIAAGCFGDGYDYQRLDDNVWRWLNVPTLVWRRSVPHGNDAMPSLMNMVNVLRTAGFSVVCLVTVRNWLANIASKVDRGHSIDATQAYDEVRAAMVHIWCQIGLAGIPALQVTYDSLRDRAAVRELLRHLNLSDAVYEQVTNEDVKHATLERFW